MAALQLDWFFPHSPERVWEALTDPELLAEWLMPNDFRPVVGHRFTFRTEPRPGFDGIVHCRVLRIEPLRELSISWSGGPLDTVVTWSVVPEGQGTRVFLTHDGFDDRDPDQAQIMGRLGNGWRGHVARRLAEVLAGGGDAGS